jgi:hypothetical protein
MKGIYLYLYLLIKEERFLPTFFVRFKSAPIYHVKLQGLPPLKSITVSSTRVPVRHDISLARQGILFPARPNQHSGEGRLR